MLWLWRCGITGSEVETAMNFSATHGEEEETFGRAFRRGRETRAEQRRGRETRERQELSHHDGGGALLPVRLEHRKQGGQECPSSGYNFSCLNICPTLLQNTLNRHAVALRFHFCMTTHEDVQLQYFGSTI